MDTAKGLVPAKDATVTADKVTAIDLGEAPDGALGVMSTAEDAVSFSVKATRSVTPPSRFRNWSMPASHPNSRG